MHLRHRFAKILPGALGGAAVLLAVGSGLGSLGPLHWLFGNLSHFRPQYVVLGLLLLPGFLAFRRGRLVFALSLLGLTLFNAAFLVPFVFGGRVDVARDRDSVSLLLWNTWRRNHDYESVLQMLRREKADVVLLQETTSTVRDRLSDLEGSYHVVISGSDVALLRRSLPHRVHVVTGRPFQGFHCELTLGAGTVDLISTHLAAPISARAAEWRAGQLESLAEWVNGRSSPVVILGDLNASPWSHEIRELRRRCRLEDSLVGCGLQPTWPYHNAFTSLLRIPLDHCLYSRGVVPFDRRVEDAMGSNHRPLLVRIALAD